MSDNRRPYDCTGAAEALDRLRRKAQNEATVIALNDALKADQAEIERLRSRLTDDERLLRILADGLDEHDDGTYSGELRTAICHAKERTRE